MEREAQERRARRKADSGGFMEDLNRLVNDRSGELLQRALRGQEGDTTRRACWDPETICPGWDDVCRRERAVLPPCAR